VGLTDDQKAMLRLLAQREEGYGDMAALMGISVEEVRERVKEALAEVDEPPGVEKKEPAPPAAPPRAVVEEPTAPAPAAATPETAAKPGRAKRPAQIPSLKLPKDRGALIGLGAGALVVVILAIVLIVGGDGGSDSSTTAAEGSATENASAAAEDPNLTQAVLSPTDGGDASGRAIFGRFKKKVLLQVTADGLEPLQDGETYTVWLYSSPKIALQIGSVPVDDSGKLAAQFEIPARLLTYVANGAFDQIDVARTSTAEYKAAFAKAKRESRVPPYVGESVLRGKITSPAIR
jgi:hypothetical protein